MRETCARVLAAALMTGVIAGVVAMSAIVGSPSEDGLPVAAPPPSLERSVHAVGLPAPRPHRTSVRRPVRAYPPSTPARPAGVARRLVIVHTRSAPSARRRLASTKPKPKAQPAAPAAPVPEPVAETQAPATTPAADQAETGDDHGNGNAYGHDKDKDHGQGHEKHAE